MALFLRFLKGVKQISFKPAVVLCVNLSQTSIAFMKGRQNLKCVYTDVPNLPNKSDRKPILISAFFSSLNFLCAIASLSSNQCQSVGHSLIVFSNSYFIYQASKFFYALANESGLENRAH